MGVKYSPLVSVVIPTIKSRKKYLERAVDSVLEQTYNNIEIVVVDEGLPATVQRNIGIERAKGDFIAFLDDDDEWMPEKIEKQMELLKQHPLASICISYSDDRRIGNGRISKPNWVSLHKDLVNGFNLSSTSSYLVRKYALDQTKRKYGYYFDESLPSGHEYDLALRLTENSHIVICFPEILMIQHKSEGQISTNWGKKVRGQYRFMEKWGHEYSVIDYLKRIGLIGLFWLGYIFGDSIMYPINFMKELGES
jgi:glycosyltransferase involved in cell wall biosynthesis